MRSSVKKLTMFFRAKVRQNEDISHKFSDARKKLREVFPDTLAEPITEYHHLCFPSEVEQAEKDGYLISSWEGAKYFLIREQKFTISGGDPKTGLVQVLEKIPDTFVVAVLTEEWAEDWVAK